MGHGRPTNSPSPRRLLFPPAVSSCCLLPSLASCAGKGNSHRAQLLNRDSTTTSPNFASLLTSFPSSSLSAFANLQILGMRIQSVGYRCISRNDPCSPVMHTTSHHAIDSYTTSAVTTACSSPGCQGGLLKVVFLIPLYYLNTNT